MCVSLAHDTSVRPRRLQVCRVMAASRKGGGSTGAGGSIRTAQPGDDLARTVYAFGGGGGGGNTGGRGGGVEVTCCERLQLLDDDLVGHGHVVWDCGLVLAAHLAGRHHGRNAAVSLRKCCVLELGAGPAIPGTAPLSLMMLARAPHWRGRKVAHCTLCRGLTSADWCRLRCPLELLHVTLAFRRCTKP